MESPKQFGASDEQTKPVGSGPYVLDTAKTVVGSKYVYTKNADYWAPDSVYYDNLVITVLADKQTQVNAIKGGQVTGLNVIDQTTLKEIEGAGFGIFPHELDWTGLMLMDHAGSVNEAIGKVEVRQAINHAIDRDAMLQAVAQGHGTVTGQVFPETSPGYDAALDEAYPFDPEKAKELLADAGYPDGFELDMPLLQVGIDDELRPGQAVPRRRGHHGQLHPARRQRTRSRRSSAASTPRRSSSCRWTRPRGRRPTSSSLETATFNPFHQPDETVAELVVDDPERRGVRGGRRDRGAQQVRRRPGLVQPVVPRRGQLRRRREHRRHSAERQRLPVPLEHQAEGLTRSAIGPGGPPPLARRPTTLPLSRMSTKETSCLDS